MSNSDEEITEMRDSIMSKLINLQQKSGSIVDRAVRLNSIWGYYKAI